MLQKQVNGLVRQKTEAKKEMRRLGQKYEKLKASKKALKRRVSEMESQRADSGIKAQKHTPEPRETVLDAAQNIEARPGLSDGAMIHSSATLDHNREALIDISARLDRLEGSKIADDLCDMKARLDCIEGSKLADDLSDIKARLDRVEGTKTANELFDIKARLDTVELQQDDSQREKARLDQWIQSYLLESEQ